ncbi:MAG: hypothetical protein WBH76_02640 [Dictyoglomaceae bacterium]|nr:hypothetical protein [Dictyoglomaceae bacterium]HPU44152.1 hypothetical protein [Dictyoglomaceae bacterium]
MAKRIIRGILILIFLIFTIHGFMREEYIEVFRNATLLCLSCIGIQ